MSSEIENPTIVRNPNRSLWEAALLGHANALAELAFRMWPPVYVWFRASGSDAADAAQRTEDFFARLQTTDGPRPDEESVTHFQDFVHARLASYAELGFPAADIAQQAATSLVIDRAKAEKRFAQEPSGRGPDELFTRRWALTILEATLEALRQEYGAEGKEKLFSYLPQFLSFSGGEERYAEIAPQAGVSVSALHVTVFRFRQRYRELLRRFVGDTVREEADVDSELTKLLVGAS
jgi:RNA polymerase sigma-70 factor (ECF subfamily)